MKKYFGFVGSGVLIFCIGCLIVIAIVKITNNFSVKTNSDLYLISVTPDSSAKFHWKDSLGNCYVSPNINATFLKEENCKGK